MNYIKIKLSKRDVESIEKNLEALFEIKEGYEKIAKKDNLGSARHKRTLDMFRKRVKNGIKEKKPYKRQEVYKK